MMVKKARPIHSIGGTPTKDHLFGDDNRSLCGNWMFGGGEEVNPTTDGDRLAAAVEDGELCTRCARKAGVLDE